MSRKRINISWDKSYLMTAEQVSLLGLLGISVHELNTHRDVPRLAHLAEAMENHPDSLVEQMIEIAAHDKAKRIRE